ncbi:DinB family protein [Alloalcanivorax gelatiniphagus]
MSDDIWVPPPWEPPIDGTETEHLLGALRRQRATVRWKADGLDEAGLRHRLPSSALSLGGLLLHLAMGEDYYLTTKLRGERLVEPWRSLGHDGTDEWEFTTTSLSAAETYAVYDEAVVRNTARIEDALAEGGLDLVAHVDDGNGNHPRLRRLLLDMIEEYSRHTGHADLLREALDGRVGEDPPDGWTPTS